MMNKIMNNLTPKFHKLNKQNTHQANEIKKLAEQNNVLSEKLDLMIKLFTEK